MAKGNRLKPKSKGAGEGMPSAGASLRWSHGAHAAFRRCQRQYAFSSLVAHHNAKDPQRRAAHIQKQLIDPPTWRGNLVDAAIAQWVVPHLRDGNLMPLDEVLKRVGAMQRSQLEFSRSGAYRSTSKQAGGESFCALKIHERGEEVSEDQQAEVREEVAQALRNLYADTAFLQSLRGHALYQPKHRFNLSVGSFLVGGEMDLLIWRMDGSPTIIDWKAVTGFKGDHSFQLMVYAFVASRLRPRVAPTSIRLQEVRMLDWEVRLYPMNQERLHEAEGRILQSARGMAALVQGRSYDELDWDDLEAAENPNTCGWCPYRDLCLQKSP